MSRYRNKVYNISGGTTNLLIFKAEKFIFGRPVDENEAIFFDELTQDLGDIALESTKISELTALHKILYKIAYNDLYLELYDDLDWITDINDFTEYVIDMFKETNSPVPREFYYKNIDLIYQAKYKYNDLFINNLWYFVNSAFAYLWHRKSFLYQFNYKMSLVSKEKITRVQYFPRWLLDALITREKGKCHYCQTIVVSPANFNQSYDIDHMIAIDNRGTNDPTNLVLSCPACNNKKRAKFVNIPDVFAWPKVP